MHTQTSELTHTDIYTPKCTYIHTHETFFFHNVYSFLGLMTNNQEKITVDFFFFCGEWGLNLFFFLNSCMWPF